MFCLLSYQGFVTPENQEWVPNCNTCMGRQLHGREVSCPVKEEELCLRDLNVLCIIDIGLGIGNDLLLG